MSDWQTRAAALAHAADPLRLARISAPEGFSGRESAVLIAIAEGDDGLDVLLIERAHGVGTHAGQPAFPGGAVEPHDADIAATALREAQEETGVDPADVTVLAVLPRLHLAVSGYAVTPVLAHWHRPTEVWAADPAEVASVVRVPIAALANPQNRVMVVHPSGGHGPGFRVAGLGVWGFTGALLAGLLDALDWSEPWDTSRIIPLADL